MKIAVFGAGGVGGYFGGLLANSGHEVSFVARGEHLAAINNKGLEIHSINGDFTIFPVQATDDPGKIGNVDYIIVSVKHYNLPVIAQQLKPLVGPETTVVPLLNGIDAHEYLIDVIGENPVIGGLCSIVSMIESPGTIYQPSRMRRIILGELNHKKSARVESLVQALTSTGIEAVHAEDIFVSLWGKYVFIASFGGVSSLARVNIGELHNCSSVWQFYAESIQEAVGLARALGIQLAPDIVESTLRMTASFEPTATSSMQRDVASGKPFELEAFSGKIVQLGDKFGVETPNHRVIYTLLLPALKRALDKEVESSSG